MRVDKAFRAADFLSKCNELKPNEVRFICVFYDAEKKTWRILSNNVNYNVRGLFDIGKHELIFFQEVNSCE